MADTLRVVLELGKKRRVVAGAIDWPGLDRWGTSEADSIEKLVAYAPRYARVAERAGRGEDFQRTQGTDVVERVPGSSSTDFWGVAHVPSRIERSVLTSKALEARLRLLQACWDYFDEVAANASPTLRPGSRSGGRSRDQIVEHVLMTEPDQFSRKVEVRTPLDVVMTPAGLANHRRDFLEAIRVYSRDGKPARTWPIQFLVRRVANHVMDHAWELEDRAP